jgi:hypothetical protein
MYVQEDRHGKRWPPSGVSTLGVGMLGRKEYYTYKSVVEKFSNGRWDPAADGGCGGLVGQGSEIVYPWEPGDATRSLIKLRYKQVRG